MTRNLKTGLDLLREPFPANQISKLPKPTKAQTEEVRKDFKAGIRCSICGSWHHPKVVHLDYVGHAALTDRLLDCDPEWNWEPVARSEDGTPKLDGNGGMWIKLTICGITRLGYGHPDGKTGGDAIKEVIGDALRNAAMRFGAALDLWHKGDLHADGDEEPEGGEERPAGKRQAAKEETPFDDTPDFDPRAAANRIKAKAAKMKSAQALDDAYNAERPVLSEIKAANPKLFEEVVAAFKTRKDEILDEALAPEEANAA